MQIHQIITYHMVYFVVCLIDENIYDLKVSHFCYLSAIDEVGGMIEKVA